eukprot:jgi/Orpsp1_1/1191225/evm.model.d7180000084223.1
MKIINIGINFTFAIRETFKSTMENTIQNNQSFTYCAMTTFNNDITGTINVETVITLFIHTNDRTSIIGTFNNIIFAIGGIGTYVKIDIWLEFFTHIWTGTMN